MTKYPTHLVVNICYNQIMEKKEVAKTFKSQFDRLLIIDNLLRNKKYPTTKELAEKLELSERQVQRLIKMMIDKFNAPIVKDGHENGLCYGLEGFSITNISYDENETFALQVCSNFAKRTLRGSNIYNKLNKGLSTLQNFAESYDTSEGVKLANRVQFAIKTNPIGHNIRSNQKNLEDILLNAIKEGQLIRISVRSWKDDAIHQETILPILVSMYNDFSWVLVYIKKEAFSEDFSSVNLNLQNLGVIDIFTITAINFYKDTFAKPVFIKNDFSFIGESAVLSEESTTNGGFKYNLGLCFKLLFSELSNPKSFNIFAHFYYDDEEYIYKIDDSIENQLMDGVFVVEEDDFIPQKNNSDKNSFPKDLLI